jgi:hypothetical protein
MSFSIIIATILSFASKVTNIRRDLIWYSLVTIFLELGPVHFISNREIDKKLVTVALTSAV